MSLPHPWLAHYPPGVPAVPHPARADALSAFRASLAAAPERPAILYFDRRIDYAELDRLSDALAVALAEGGFVRGDRLAIYLQNTPQFPIAVLAAWKLGGSVVTLNPMNREYELARLLDDARPRALLCEYALREAVLARLPDGTHRPAILLCTAQRDLQSRNDPRVMNGGDAAGAAGVAPPAEDLLATLGRHLGRRPADFTPNAADTAAIVYTSGTTGQPKGALISHGNLAAVCAAQRAWFALEEGTIVLAAAPLFHITGLAGHMALAWSMAAPLVLCYRFEPGVVLDAIAEHRPQCSISAITAYIALMNRAEADQVGRERLASLATVVSGGAPVPPSIARQVEQKLGWRILNGYGLTETASGVIIMPRGAAWRVDAVSGALSIGVPLSGVEAWIEGEDGRRLGHDEIGEIVVAGPMVSAGYWMKPADSAESMRPDGFRTGDIGFMDKDGWFYVVDRKKDMINASGYKVWPREVEDVLYAHPAVREAAVVGIGDAYRGETVKAVISLRRDQAASREELVAWCRERLAAYKVPRTVEIMDDLPKSAVGKILRRALREDEPAA